MLLLATAFVTLGSLAPLGVAPHAPDGAPPPPGFLLDGIGLRVLTAEEASGGPGPFPVGERVVYEVGYYGVPIGSAEIAVARLVEYEGARYAHLVATARTNDFFSSFYPVDDRHEAWVDLANGTVARTRTRTLHGGREAHEEAVFDWTTHYVDEWEVKFGKGKQYRVAFDFGPYVYDVLDAFYALRMLPLEEGFGTTLAVYASEKVYGFHVEVGEKSALTHPVLGPVDVFEVRPSATVDGEGEGAGDGRVVVLAEPGHLPVLMSGWFRASKRLRVGGMRAELVAYEPGEGAWPRSGPRLPPPQAETQAGGRIPQWDPPEAVLDARRRSGVEPRDEDAPWPGREASLEPAASPR